VPLVFSCRQQLLNVLFWPLEHDLECRVGFFLNLFLYLFSAVQQCSNDQLGISQLLNELKIHNWTTFFFKQVETDGQREMKMMPLAINKLKIDVSV